MIEVSLHTVMQTCTRKKKMRIKIDIRCYQRCGVTEPLVDMVSFTEVSPRGPPWGAVFVTFVAMREYLRKTT
jgi:hypothetical protein